VLLKTARRTQTSRPLDVCGVQFQCAGIVIVNYRNKELIWLSGVSQIKRRQATDLACQALSLLGQIGCQSENWLRFEQPVHPVMHYACPVLISAAHTQVRKLRVIQLMRFRPVATVSLYVCNKQIHESLGNYIFRRPHQSPNREFRLRISWCGEPPSSATEKARVPTKG
jgi:hypothetical protein